MFPLIAANVISLLVPYVKKAMEEFSGEAGKAVFKTVGSLFTKVKTFFTGDSAATDTFDRFEKDPEKYKPFLEDVIKEKMEEDPSFKESISDLLEQIKKEGATLKIVQKMQKGENVTGVDAGEIGNANIDVQQEIVEGKMITGVKAGKIGK
jgi:hypothetical protein